MNRKRWAICTFVLLAGVLLFLSGCGKKQAATATGGKQSFTLLLYIIGSDLESVDGAASADIMEILEAVPGGNVKIAAQTGGTTHWANEAIGEQPVQRFLIQDKALALQENVGAVNMADSGTLKDFLSWAETAAPSDRYALIFWDHGGGTILGYGQDEYYPEEILSLDELQQTMEDTGLHFDFVGFDACLMGTLETAVAFADHADYLIASEEYEPGTGWFYTDWIKALCANTDIGIPELGQKIIDDFVSEKHTGRYDFSTLALIDLKQVPALYEAVDKWLEKTVQEISQPLRFAGYSETRSRVKSYGNGNYDQVDLVALMEASGESPERDAVLAAAEKAIIYTAHNATVDVANGLALYYPYVFAEDYVPVTESMETVGYEDPYFSYYDYFVNTLIQGQNIRFEQENEQDFIGVVRAAGKLRHQELLNRGAAQESGEDETRQRLEVEKIHIRNYNQVYNIPEDEKPLITDIRFLQLNPVQDGYVYVGKQGSKLTRDARGFDLSGGHYLAINDQLVSYQPVYDSEAEDFRKEDLFQLDTSSREALNASLRRFIYENDIRISPEEEQETHGEDWVRYGYVDAFLNDTDFVRLQLNWDYEHPEGVVAGYRVMPEDAIGMEQDKLYLPGRGLQQLKPGDTLKFFFYHFDDNANYDGIVYLGDGLTCGEDTALKVGRCYQPFDWVEPANVVIFTGDKVLIGDTEFLFTYRITDVYRNVYYVNALDMWEDVERFSLDASDETLGHDLWDRWTQQTEPAVQPAPAVQTVPRSNQTRPAASGRVLGAGRSQPVTASAPVAPAVAETQPVAEPQPETPVAAAEPQPAEPDKTAEITPEPVLNPVQEVTPPVPAEPVVTPAEVIPPPAPAATPEVVPTTTPGTTGGTGTSNPVQPVLIPSDDDDGDEPDPPYIEPSEEHDWDEGHVETPATCSSTGTITYTCTDCGATRTEELPINAANHVGATSVINSQAATCGADGYTGDVICEGCHAVLEAGEVIPATGDHSWNEGEVTTAATCVTEGVKTFTCTVCSATRTEPMDVDPDNHQHLTMINEVQATCTTPGYSGDSVCADCETLVEAGTVIPAGHNWDGGVETLAATCVTAGVRTYTCLNCGETQEEIIPEDPNNHVHTHLTDVVAATCGVDGFTGNLVCDDCLNIVQTGEVVLATGEHDWVFDEYLPDSDKDRYVCSVCGAVRYEDHVDMP